MDELSFVEVRGEQVKDENAVTDFKKKKKKSIVLPEVWGWIEPFMIVIK